MVSEERLWLLECGSVPPCHCPYEPPNTVVLGLSWLGTPPGRVVGEFSLDEAGGVQVKLYGKDVQVPTPTRCCGTCFYWQGNSTMNWAKTRCRKHPEWEDLPVPPSWICDDHAWDKTEVKHKEQEKEA